MQVGLKWDIMKRYYRIGHTQPGQGHYYKGTLWRTFSVWSGNIMKDIPVLNLEGDIMEKQVLSTEGYYGGDIMEKNKFSLNGDIMKVAYYEDRNIK